MTPQEITDHWGPKDPDRDTLHRITPRMLSLVETFERGGGDLDAMWNGLRDEEVWTWAFGPLTTREPVASDQIRRDVIAGGFVKLVKELRERRMNP